MIFLKYILERLSFWIHRKSDYNANIHSDDRLTCIQKNEFSFWVPHSINPSATTLMSGANLWQNWGDMWCLCGKSTYNSVMSFGAYYCFMGFVFACLFYKNTNPQWSIFWIYLPVLNSLKASHSCVIPSQ